MLGLNGAQVGLLHGAAASAASVTRWGILLAAVTIILVGCASSQLPVDHQASPTSTDIQRVGPLRVLLRPQPEVELMCRLHAQQQGTRSGRILGCYVPTERAIISTPDAQVLLHEFRHYFEGAFHD